MIKKLGGDVLKLNEALSVTKKSRENSHNTLYKLMEELHGKLVKEVASERQERNRNEETLIRFLDETVNKTNESIENY